MITKLKLIGSSFFFHKSINLTKNCEVEVDTAKLDEEEIETLNYYITLGFIKSTEGLLPEYSEEDSSEEEKVDEASDDEQKNEELPSIEVKQESTEPKPSTTTKARTSRSRSTKTTDKK